MSHRNPFALESLEKRQHLSMTSATWVIAAATGASSATTVKLPFPIPAAFGLSGTASGTYLRSSHNPDTGSTYSLSGSGNVSPLGADSLTGTLTAPGFVANGKLTGSVTLNNAHGSVTASVTGPAPTATTAAATSTIKLTYTITSATGRYRGTAGTGSATLTFGTLKVLPPTAVGVTAGSFTLTFKTGIVPLM